MAADVRIPTLGESVTEGVIVRWIKSEGEAVKVDEPLLELETDKASVEIPAESGGVLHILKPEGETVQVGDVVGRIENGKGQKTRTKAEEPSRDREGADAGAQSARATSNEPQATPLSPAVRRLVEENAIEPSAISGTGKGGRLTKGDVLAHLDEEQGPGAKNQGPRVEPRATSHEPRATSGDEQRVPMTRLRLRIAERLLQAQQSAAILTTFNEVDMSAAMDLRARYKDRFKEVHGVGLGFMSFFARACVQALKELPIVNARIDGTDIVYQRHVNLGVAVATERGLIVPILHRCDELSFAQIETEIARIAGLARQNKLSIDDLSGGTFSISNGGIFGSLLSTPILNPPQSAILGMHKIEKRPVVVNDQIAIRPMMYVALSYDHRLIDGEHAVTFLVRVKERLEDPGRLLLEV